MSESAMYVPSHDILGLIGQEVNKIRQTAETQRNYSELGGEMAGLCSDVEAWRRRIDSHDYEVSVTTPGSCGEGEFLSDWESAQGDVQCGWWPANARFLDDSDKRLPRIRWGGVRTPDGRKGGPFLHYMRPETFAPDSPPYQTYRRILLEFSEYWNVPDGHPDHILQGTCFPGWTEAEFWG